MVNQKRGLANEDESAAKKWKVIIPEVKLDINRISENDDSTAKIEWDQNLHEAMMQIVLKKSNE